MPMRDDYTYLPRVLSTAEFSEEAKRAAIDEAFAKKYPKD